MTFFPCNRNADRHPQESIISPIDRRSETYRHIAAEVAAKHPEVVVRVRQPILTIPNILTFLRLIMVPVLMLLWEMEWRYSPITGAAVFIGAALTDWLDGHLARRVGAGACTVGGIVRWVGEGAPSILQGVGSAGRPCGPQVGWGSTAELHCAARGWGGSWGS